MTDLTAARANMIVSQIRPNGITDAALIEAMAQVLRETFVPVAARDLAYMDEDVPLKPGRWLIEPMALARLLQLAAVSPGDHVLHVGCATGYGSAILARLAHHVVALDEDPELIALCIENLAGLSVSPRTGLHAEGAPDTGPYDVIMIEGRVPAVPPALLHQLKDGGRLVTVVGANETSSGRLFRRHAGSISERIAFDCSVAILPGFTVERPAFIF